MLDHTCDSLNPVRGSQAVPNAHLSREQWKEWRDKEKHTERNERRLREAVDRITSFARCCFNKFWGEREKKKRTLRVGLAVLRKARNVAAARSAWSAVRGQLSAARLQRAQAVRPKRMSAVLHDIAVQRKQAKLARKTKEKGAPPAQTARLNLTAAATVGPVLTDMYVAARGRMGDG